MYRYFELSWQNLLSFWLLHCQNEVFQVNTTQMLHMHWLSRALHYLLVFLFPRFSFRRQLEERLAKVVVPMITYIVPYILVIRINWLVHMHWLAVSAHWVSMHVYDDCISLWSHLNLRALYLSVHHLGRDRDTASTFQQKSRVYTTLPPLEQTARAYQNGAQQWHKKGCTHHRAWIAQFGGS